MSKVWRGTRARVYQRDGLVCRYCGIQCVEARQNDERKMTGVATVDHVIPRSEGGSNGFDNLVTACFTCNTRKAKRTGEEYAAYLAERAQK